MIKRIKKLVGEIFAGYVENDWNDSDDNKLVPVEKNLSYNEFMKFLNNTTSQVVRVILEDNGVDFYIWDADLLLHSYVMDHFNIRGYKLVVYKSESSGNLIVDLEDIQSLNDAKLFLRDEAKYFSKLPFIKKFKVESVYLYPQVSFDIKVR